MPRSRVPFPTYRRERAVLEPRSSEDTDPVHSIRLTCLFSPIRVEIAAMQLKKYAKFKNWIKTALLTQHPLLVFA